MFKELQFGSSVKLQGATNGVDELDELDVVKLSSFRTHFHCGWSKLIPCSLLLEMCLAASGHLAFLRLSRTLAKAQSKSNSQGSVNKSCCRLAPDRNCYDAL